MTAEKDTGRLWRLHTKITVEDGTPILFVVGRLDHARSAEFEAAAARHAPNASGEAVIDLSGVDYIGSAGLKVLVSFADRLSRAGGRLRLRAPSTVARLALELSGLANLIDAGQVAGDEG